MFIERVKRFVVGVLIAGLAVLGQAEEKTFRYELPLTMIGPMHPKEYMYPVLGTTLTIKIGEGMRTIPIMVDTGFPQAFVVTSSQIDEWELNGQEMKDHLADGVDVAGLQKGDEITALGMVPLNWGVGLIYELAQYYDTGDVVPVTFNRSGQQKTVSVTLQAAQ